MLTFGSFTVASAQTATPSPAPTPRLTFTGLLDFYYQYEFNNPKYPSPPPLYNERQDALTLTLAQLDANYAPPANGGFGAHVTLINGDTAALDHTGNETRFEDIMQAYVTAIDKKGYGVDFGGFYTPFGYEATNDSNLNPNYSFSDVYSYLMPTYNAGLRFYTPTIWNGWVFKGYVVNALNDTSNEGFHDDNNAKGLIGAATYTDPKGKWTGTENIGFSHDQDVAFSILPTQLTGPGDGNTDDTTLSDTDLTVYLSPKLTLGAEYVYRQDSATAKTVSVVEELSEPAASPDGVTLGPPHTTVNDGIQTTTTAANAVSYGYAAYLVYDTTPLDDVAFRYSYVSQSAIGDPYDLTLTYAIKSPNAKWLTKFEYRYDHVQNGLISTLLEDSSGNLTKTSDNTVTVGEVYTF